MRSVLALVAACVFMAGCLQNTPDYDTVGTPQPADLPAADDGSLVVAQGSVAAIEPYVNQEGLDDSSTVPVDAIKSDDPTIATVAPTANDYDVRGSLEQHEHAWVVSGVAPGVTTLRFLDDDGDEMGSIDVHVVVQNP